MVSQNILNRNKKIAENGKATRLKRSNQVCKTFKLKIPSNRINNKMKEHLKMVFVESKWIYNYLLSISEEINIFDIVSNYKNLDTVTHLDQNKEMVESKVTHVLSSVRQELMHQIANQIKGLSKLKKKGHNVGQLKFKSDFNSVKYKQYGVTHYIIGNKIKIQGLKDPIPVLGLDQIKRHKNVDITTMNLIKEVDEYYVCLTCYFDKEKKEKTYNNDILGIDLGICDNLTFSNGKKISCYVEESERVKNLQRQIERSKKGSNNRYKLRKKLAKAYAKDANRRNDFANKIVHSIVTNNRLVIIQDDNLNSMKDDNANTEKADVIQHSILGRVKSRLKQHDNVIWLDRWCPTTQYCTKCGHKTKHGPSQRIYKCKYCGCTEDRDIHAANNMIHFFTEYCKLKGIDTSQELAGVLTAIKWNDLKSSLCVA